MNNDITSLNEDKINFGHQLNKAFFNDDMNGVFDVLSTYMFFTGQKVTSESVARFSEDGLISDDKPIQKDQKPFNDN